MDLTDAQWEVIESYFPQEELQKPGPLGGRPWSPAREVLNGVLWVLRTGAPWKDLPGRYPSFQTCHRRFQRWIEMGVLPRVLAGLRRDLCTRGGVEDVEGYIDGTSLLQEEIDTIPFSRTELSTLLSLRTFLPD